MAWGSCGVELRAFECATVEVPTDYDRLRGPTTTIALTRWPATDPAHKIGTLFTNPGGPGGSGVDFVHQSGQTAYQSGMRARFDILGFGRRLDLRAGSSTVRPGSDETKLFEGPGL